MAILDDLPGLKAEIIVNGKALEEFENDDDDVRKPKLITKYIEATSNAAFEVHFQFDQKLRHEYCKYTYTCKVFLDGKYGGGMVILEDSLFQKIIIRGNRTMKANQHFVELFSFAKLTVDDGDPHTIDQNVKDVLNCVGEISVKIQRYKVTGYQDSTGATGTISQLGSIPEKALKGRAISHQAMLQAPQPTASFRQANGEYIDPAESPFATFNFRYRSRDALKALYIIPRSPSPVALEDRSVEDLTPEEMRELLKRQCERDAAARNVKREVKRERTEDVSGSFEDDDELAVVEERPRKRYRTVTEGGIETVDLT